MKTEENSITTAQRRRTMRCALGYSTSTTVGNFCLIGQPLILFVLNHNASESYLGMLTFMMVIPYIFRLTMLSALEKAGKKALLIKWNALALIFMAPVPLLPILGDKIPQNALLATVITLVFFQSLFIAFAGTGWFPLLQDNVPSKVTGKFFANLRTTWRIALVITTTASALFFGSAAADWKFTVVFSIGLVLFVLRVLVVLPMSENPPAKRTKPAESLPARLVYVFKSRPLRSLALYSFFFIVASSCANPFKTKLLRDLGYSDRQILIASASMVSVGAVITLRFWGRILDRFGNRSVISLANLGMALSSLGWLFVGSNSTISFVLVMLLYLLWSVFQSAQGLAQTRCGMLVIPKSRQGDLVVVNTFLNLGAALGPLFAGHLIASLIKIPNLESIWAYRCLFVVSALILFIPHFLRKDFRLPSETPTNKVVSRILTPMGEILRRQ